VKKTILILTLVLCGAALAAPASGRAAYDPIASGQTKLRFDKSFLALLKRNGATLRAAAGARLRAGSAIFPVSGGRFDPVSAKGFIEHDGALLFKRGGHELRLTSLQLKTTRRRAPYAAKLGGGQLKLAAAATLVVNRRGFGERMTVSTLRLSAKVATRLEKKLRLPNVFQAGQLLGDAVTTADPLTVSLRRAGEANLSLDPGFQAKLSALFVAVNPIFPAEHPGPFTLPIFGGTLAPDAGTGKIELSGALEFLQLGGGQVFWHDPSLDFAGHSLNAEAEVDPSPPYAGKLVALQIASTEGDSVSADPRAREIAVSGPSLALGSQMAAIFEDVFAKPQGRSGVFSAGEPVGRASFEAKGQ